MLVTRRALLLSAYDAASHQRWARGLVTHLGEDYDWTIAALAPRHFAWRARGNPITWALGPAALPEHDDYALIVATSMVELATLRGLRPKLARVPTLLYFHENQFAYPGVERDPNALHLQLGSVTSALAADRIVFNSRYNRDTFLSGVHALLKRMPDHAPAQAVSLALARRAEVLAVPLEDALFERPRPTTRRPGPARLTWNHRWEHDKAPERWFDALIALAKAGHDFEVRVLGQRFRRAPEAFERGRAALGSRVIAWGYLPDLAAYHDALRDTDIVCSSALHDFQGLAMLEAAALGASPLAPARVAYSEWFGPEHLYDSREDAPDAEREALCQALERSLYAPPPPPDLAWLSWAAMAPHYRGAIQRAITSHEEHR